MRGRVVLVLAGTALVVLVPAQDAAAHPLGNFTVSHHDALVLTPDGVKLTAVVDRAEIPTAQMLRSLAPDGDPTADQLRDAAAAECPLLAAAVRLTVDGAAVTWTLQSSAAELVPGMAGLPTLRLTCGLTADADLESAATVAFRDDYLADRVGWREITADGSGVRLLDSPVPVDSITDALRSYPDDLLASPLDVRAFEVATEPGENSGGAAAPSVESGDPFSTTMAALDRRLQSLVSDRDLTPAVGAVAILLAVLLGCGHALLPGHGKTVMAAYLAGRRGRPRDALTVGATVTATHTVGVLALGVAISLSSTLAGDQALRWLGMISGALVALIGVIMLRSALRERRSGPAAVEERPEPALAAEVPALTGAGVSVSRRAAAGPGHGHAHHDHDHDGHHDGHDGHHDHHDHYDHDGHHDHGHGRHDLGHGRHGHDHNHHGHDQDRHGHGHPNHGGWPGVHRHGPGVHVHGPGRGGLIGMGVAGGLVPSPSALIVLLASIGLGRTVFGVVLVLAYGLGMAGTLTIVGLTLLRLRDRLGRRLTEARGRLLLRIARAAPVGTAALVLLVGVALVLRGVTSGA